MNAKRSLDMDRIARGLGARRAGTVRAASGAFGAARVAAEVSARFRPPIGGGRSMDPTWTEQRLVRLTPSTLKKLEAIAERATTLGGTPVAPLQVASLLLERATEESTAHDRATLARKRSA